MEKKKRVVVIAGPTASGKSALALELAKSRKGVIINADSMQVYRDLSILTARPQSSETSEVPHRLYGIFPGDEVCSVRTWRKLALEEIAAVTREGRLPILVGGTGLYLRALEEGLAEVPEIPPRYRKEAEALLAKAGPEALHRSLSERDRATAARLKPTDRQRLIRAWEVLEATGQSITTWQAAPVQAGAFELSLDYRRILCLPPRDWLYARINRRLEMMLDQGALEELERLSQKGLDPSLPVMKALGVPHFLSYLSGEISLPDALEKAQQETRRYAKRQFTWFRHQVPEGGTLRLGAPGGPPYPTEITKEIEKFLGR